MLNAIGKKLRNRFFSVEGLAARVDVTESWIEALIQTGRLESWCIHSHDESPQHLIPIAAAEKTFPVLLDADPNPPLATAISI